MGLRQVMSRIARGAGREQMTRRMRHPVHSVHQPPAYGPRGARPLVEDDTTITYGAYGHRPKISMRAILDSYDTSPRLATAVNQYVEQCTSDGYHWIIENSDDHIKQAEQADRVLDEFFAAFDFQSTIREITHSLFLFGNSFVTPLRFGAGDRFTGLHIIPTDSIIGIYRRGGITEHYIQQTATSANGTSRATSSGGFFSGIRRVQADYMHHIARARVNASPWGEGLGQHYCTPLTSYKDSGGETVTPPSVAEMESWQDHMAIMSQHVTLPRPLVRVSKMESDARERLVRDLAGARPMTSIAVEADQMDVQHLNMQTEGRMGDQQTRLNNLCTIALHSPLLPLMESKNVQALASSQELSKTAFPLIEGHKLMLERWVNEYVIRPVMDRYMPKGTYDRLRIRFHFGAAAKHDPDLVYKMTLLAKEKFFADIANPEDWLAAIADACGIKTTPIPAELLQKREERAAAAQAAFAGGGKKDNDDNDNKDNNQKKQDAKKGSTGAATVPGSPPASDSMSYDTDTHLARRANAAIIRYLDTGSVFDVDAGPRRRRAGGGGTAQ